MVESTTTITAAAAAAAAAATAAAASAAATASSSASALVTSPLTSSSSSSFSSPALSPPISSSSTTFVPFSSTCSPSSSSSSTPSASASPSLPSIHHQPLLYPAGPGAYSHPLKMDIDPAIGIWQVAPAAPTTSFTSEQPYGFEQLTAEQIVQQQMLNQSRQIILNNAAARDSLTANNAVPVLRNYVGGSAR
ncbi:hypothetical protein BGW42_001435 [Actinomortierella wolfii]|nr:hypothetical protein BGW42_001435 [Actinomortierella wolfii]